jgi:hypothetical protein
MNYNRMVTQLVIDTGHHFVALEYKPRESKPKQSKQGSQLLESSNDSLSASNSEQTLHLETLWHEALKVNLTTTSAIEKMREYIRDGLFSVDYYIEMWTKRLSQPVVKWPIGLAKAIKLINFDHYKIDEVLPLLAAKQDVSGNILRRDYNTIMLNLVKGRGTIATKDTRTIEMIIDNIFSSFVTSYSLQSVLNNLTSAPFRKVAVALSLFCAGSREDKIRACFDLYDTSACIRLQECYPELRPLWTPGSIHINSIKEYLFSVFTILHKFEGPGQSSAEAMSKECADQIAYYTHEIREESVCGGERMHGGLGTERYNPFVSLDKFKQWYE